MKISGVAIIKNAIKNDYPIVEAISSILPIVDEMIVSIDKGEDNTEALIRSIASNKIKIVFSEWDKQLRKGGKVLAVETNKAMEHVAPESDWIFYIQADEVVHEKYLPAIRSAAAYYLNDKKVEGLLFKYLHFYGTYDYIGDSRQWYNCETRIIRNNRKIESYRDAQGFRKGNQKIKVAAINAYIYHYGWVKSPQQMKIKQNNVGHFWIEDDEILIKKINAEDIFDYSKFDSLTLFTESHPTLMHNRIEAKNWNLKLDIKKKRFSLKDLLLYKIEKLTGWRLFSFRNHIIIRR